MPRRKEPTWHPISALPVVGAAIMGMLESAEDQVRLLLEADEHPYALDDATVARLIRVYSEQDVDHWLFEEQLRRWGAGPLSPEQRQQVERLSRATARLKQVTTAILSMGEALKSQTIESLLAKSDLEVGLEELLRRGRSPGS
jgi:signal transduction histidine kinase